MKYRNLFPFRGRLDELSYREHGCRGSEAIR